MVWNDFRKLINSNSNQSVDFNLTEFDDFNDFRHQLASCSYKGEPAIDYFNSNIGNEEVVDLLIATIEDADGYNSGDARINATSFLSKSKPSILAQREEKLLVLYDSEDINEPGPGGCLKPMLALVLAQFHSLEAKQRILSDYEPDSYGAYHYESALAKYEVH